MRDAEGDGARNEDGRPLRKASVVVDRSVLATAKRTMHGWRGMRGLQKRLQKETAARGRLRMTERAKTGRSGRG
jgi:hypothetical protein